MHICFDCGHHFKEGEQVVYTEEHGEKVTGCPLCLGAYEEAVQCSGCGGDYLEDDLLPGGICRDCLRKKMEPETIMEYIEDEGLEKEFFVRYWAETAIPNLSISDTLLRIVKASWKFYADVVDGEADGVLNAFINGGNGIMENRFARWLKDRGGVK